MHAIPNGLHRLASTRNPEALLGTGDQQVLRNRPGLNATTATIQDLEAMRLKEEF
jgi:hypothetical protein